MVRAHDIGMDGSIGETLAQTIGNDKIVNTPSRILLTRLETV